VLQNINNIICGKACGLFFLTIQRS